MLTVEEALSLVLAQAEPRPSVELARDEALGLALAADVISDVDSPPHDKSIVDGYALDASDLSQGVAELEVLEEVTAGAVPQHGVSPGRSSRVMTGAPIPPGADAVVMIEYAELLPGWPERVRLKVDRVTHGQNILRRAASMAIGDRVLSAGHVLRPIEIGVLAEVGQTLVNVVPRPSLAALSTGNELVPPDGLPAAGQIRNSNGVMLMAAAHQAGATAVDLGIARDEPDELSERIARGLESDVLVISGGVSAGVLDLVPGVLASLGVEQVFHKVRLKPGKPLWFGIARRNGRKHLVFGLPGNPVSSLVCFELFVRPALAQLAGRPPLGLPATSAQLASDFAHRGERPTYHPARLALVAGQLQAEPLKWRGSADLATLAMANGLIVFPAGEQQHRAGESVRVLRWNA